MEFNRSKMGLIVVVMILALTLTLSGCVAPAGNKTPDFLEVGGSYVATYDYQGGIFFTVVEIRRDGWILADVRPGHVWINTTQLVYIRKEE